MVISVKKAVKNTDVNSFVQLQLRCDRDIEKIGSSNMHLCMHSVFFSQSFHLFSLSDSSEHLLACCPARFR